ncbi:MAG: tetratricopeptide repeat protein [Nitrospirae bacterium]|nr:tetratricopeptide repeat protein [Nitrospirota bacterium]
MHEYKISLLLPLSSRELQPEVVLNRLNFRKIIFYALFIFIVSAPAVSYSVQSVFTVQTGSFDTLEVAQKEFDSLVALLNSDELDSLRIEKIGIYYCVRLGRFDDQSGAENFLSPLRAKLPDAVILKAYYSESRILKLINSAPASAGPAIKEQPVQVPEKAKIRTEDKSVERPGSDSIEKQVKEIAALVERKDLAKALDLARSAASAHPESYEINGWYGVVLLKNNQPAEAIKYFRKASEMMPDVPDYHNGIGYSLFFMNKPDDAIVEFSKSLNLDASNLDALSGLGVSHAKIGQKEKAAEYYNLLKDLDRDTADKVLAIINKTQ